MEASKEDHDELIPDPFLIPENKKKYMKKGFDLAVQYGDHDAHSAEDLEIFGGIDYRIELTEKGELPVRMTVCLDYFYDKPFVTKAEREDPFRAAQFVLSTSVMVP